MNVLLDTCVYGGIIGDLSAAGHDVIWSGDWPEDPGDEEILEHANREGRVLVTLDKDFGELAVVHNKPHCGILRLVDLSSIQQAEVCIQVLDRYGQILQEGAIITAEADRLRIRPADAEV